MSTKLSAESFLNLVKQSGLIDLEQVRKLCKGFQEAGQNIEDPLVLADQLIAKNALTRWQAEKLLAGKHKGFFLGKYRLLSLLGTGGMSSVYLAEHVLMRRRVAIKILPQQRVEDSSYLQRFHREAQAVAALDHRNIVRAYDVDVDGKNHFLVMEYVAGKNLMELVQQNGLLSYVKACEYMRQAADGLSAAHKASMVHRDIKPGNLLLDDKGTIKLLDLGLARFFNEAEENSLTIQHDEKVLGTADYLSPEQARDSHNVDIRSDIYSLGCTLYFMLTGHPPFPDGTMAMRLLAHQQKEPASIRKDRPDVPDSILAICDKMMAKDVENRYQTARETAQALQQWLTENGGDEWSEMNPVIAASSLSGVDPALSGSTTRAMQPGTAKKPSTITPAAKSAATTSATSPAKAAEPAIDPALAAFFNNMASTPPSSGVTKAAKSAPPPPAQPAAAKSSPKVSPATAAPPPQPPTPRPTSAATPASTPAASTPAKAGSKSGIKPPAAKAAPAQGDAELASFFSSLAETSVATKPSATPRPVKAEATAAESAKSNGTPPAVAVAVAAATKAAVAPPVSVAPQPTAAAPAKVAAPVAAPVAKAVMKEPVIGLPEEPAQISADKGHPPENDAGVDDNLTAFFSGLTAGKAKPVLKTQSAPAVSPLPTPPANNTVPPEATLVVNPAEKPPEPAPVPVPVAVSTPAASTPAEPPVTSTLESTPAAKAVKPAKPAAKPAAPAPDFSWMNAAAAPAPIIEPLPEIDLNPKPVVKAPPAVVPSNPPVAAPVASVVTPVAPAMAVPVAQAVAMAQVVQVAQAIPVAAPVAMPVAVPPVAATDEIPELSAVGEAFSAPAPTATKAKPQKKGLSPALVGGGVALALALLAGGWFVFGPKSAPKNDVGTGKPNLKKTQKREVASNVPLNRVLEVGPGAKYTTISSALDEVKRHFNTGRRAVQVLRVTATSYPERIVLDSSYHRGVQFEVVGTEPAILNPPGVGPVVEIKGDYEGFRLENFRINANGRPVAIQVQGGVSDTLFKRLTITGFTESGIRCDGLMANLGAATRFEAITFQPETPQAVGIRFAGADSIRAEIRKCRFMGPMAAGVVYDSQAVLEMDLDGNIFNETATGVKFVGAAKHCKNLTFVNNTFYKAEKGIEFEAMPTKESTELGFFNNLFLQVKVTPAIVGRDFNEAAFSSMYAIREGTGRDNNWSDSPVMAVPGAIRICEEGSGRQNVAGLQFLSTDPASPDFLKPVAGSPLLNTPSMQHRPTHVGAVGKK